MTDVLTPTASAPAAPSVDEARAVAEAAREAEWTAPSFLRELFAGRLPIGLVHPFPAPDPARVTVSRVSFVLGSRTSKVSPLEASRRWPPMYWCMTRAYASART